MNKKMILALVGGLCIAACGSSTGAGSNGGGGSTADTSSNSGNQDNTNNKASIQTKSDTGQAGQVSASAAASAAAAQQTSGKQFGAMNAGKILNLFITDASGSFITVVIDTDKNPLPKSGIAIGEPNSGAWVTYAYQGMVYNSKDKGTLDITACPTQSGVAADGVLHDVVVNAVAPMAGMAASYTLNGTFNLVYFGGAGEIACTPPATNTGSDAGSSTGGGASCNFGDCDNGTNTTRNCCPYVPCLSKCFTDCTSAVQGCVMGCATAMPPDPSCATKCVSDVITCEAACGPSCKVSDACGAKLTALDDCYKTSADSCQNSQDAHCQDNACCAQSKAAF